MQKSLFPILFLIVFHLSAQMDYPKESFQSPLEIPLVLAGTFGELRSNHFHSGIDIKTQQREGLPVLAISDGTITRIVVKHWGYGKALYVAHPNGYTSVYGHLQKFSPEIEAYVKKVQYQKQSYEVEIFPDYGEVKVTKGNTIAYSGNTGGSAGPHLHFEIRNSVNSKPTNPLLYGYDVRDATDPTLLGLYGYPLSDDAMVNQSQEKIQLNYTKQADGSFLADKVSAIGTIGFGINTFDRLDLAANKNGIYSIKQIVNGREYSNFDFETFSFGETRYINTLIDYEHFYDHRQRIQKIFKEPYNHLSIYNTLYNNGKIDITEGMSYNVEFLIADIEGNTTKLVVPIEGKREAVKIPRKDRTTENYVIASKPNNYDLGAAKVYFPANTFYEDFYINLEKGNDTITIHDNSVAAHRNFTISFDPSKYAQEDRDQLFIAHLDIDGRPSHSTTYKRDGSFTTRTRTLGTYTLVKDSVAPTIKPKNFKAKQWLNNFSYLSLRITDDLSGIDTYSATLNGKWILMEYEPKNNTITYNFEDNISNETENELIVTVTDNVGNSTTYSTTFFRK
ncbi:M23 family metallopeptidase [Flagellimonas zhangzhouensis]|uniref:Peptidase family M23 n=1 Tax=Flagellimonas zhangzhouensis TaxID=1073328 RepID=A0A1H2R337_9FLAO|nr:M23 family metallopeptidase [Allomuricauda zhangzhouensis]SDQ59024.1 Peptidase family M23 [Allomuricauda zhangzhouensis]SDW13550.1 Peptidase family M23 [Allomuricauda zhangzhouensis]